MTEWVITNGDCIISDVLHYVTNNGPDRLRKKHNAVWPFRGEPSSNRGVPTAAMYSDREVSQQVIWSLPCTFHLILQIRYDNSRKKVFLYKTQQHKYELPIQWLVIGQSEVWHCQGENSHAYLNQRRVCRLILLTGRSGEAYRLVAGSYSCSCIAVCRLRWVITLHYHVTLEM